MKKMAGSVRSKEDTVRNLKVLLRADQQCGSVVGGAPSVHVVSSRSSPSMTRLVQRRRDCKLVVTSESNTAM